ncbi:MAG: glycosyltransferase, partial [Bacteroidetes bacterium]|nr:glycosyltransferase [Bacteroidota bacterium]
MGPKVSVIITNYNYAQYVAQAINSVLNQTYSNIELIVVNNGSTDNSLEILEEYGNQIHLVDQQNAGQSGA